MDSFFLWFGSTNLMTLILAIVGGGVVAYLSSRAGGEIAKEAALEAMVMQIDSQRKTDEQKKNEEKKSLAFALVAELIMLKKFINERVNEFKKAQEQELIMSIYIEESYFDIYNSNADKIGIFEKNSSKKIVEAYMEVKSIYDSARTLTKITGQIETLKKNIYLDREKEQEIRDLFDEKLVEYQVYSGYLLGQVDNVTKLIDDAISILELEAEK